MKRPARKARKAVGLFEYSQHHWGIFNHFCLGCCCQRVIIWLINKYFTLLHTDLCWTWLETFPAVLAAWLSVAASLEMDYDTVSENKLLENKHLYSRFLGVHLVYLTLNSVTCVASLTLPRWTKSQHFFFLLPPVPQSFLSSVTSWAHSPKITFQSQSQHIVLPFFPPVCSFFT